MRVLSGFGRPFGIGRDRDGRILIADMDLHGIARLSEDLSAYEWLDDFKGWTSRRRTLEGRSQRTARRNPGAFNGPHSVTCASDGRIFVTTYYTPGLFVLDASGRLIKQIAPKGFALRGPATGVLALDGMLLVTEYALHGIFKFTEDGEFMGALGGGGEDFRDTGGFAPGVGVAAFDRPHMAISDADGHIVVADTWNHRLQKFTKDGKFLGVLGGASAGWHCRMIATPAGKSATSFNAPVALCVTPNDGLLVTDWGNNRLKWNDRAGAVVKVQDDLGLDKPYDAQVFTGRCIVANSHCGEVIDQTGSA